MRILHAVEYYAPSIGGAQEVVRQVSERLAARGHDVTVATSWLPERREKSLNGVRIEEFRISGNQVRGFDGEVDRYSAFLRDTDADVVLTYAAQQWTFDLCAAELTRLPRRLRKVCAPCGYSGLHLPAYAGYFRELPSVLRQFDACVYHSEGYRDVRFARDHGLTNGVLIANGAGEEISPASGGDFRRKFGIPDEALLCLSVANYGLAKGQDRVIDAFRRAKTGAAWLVLIGERLPPRRTPFRLLCGARVWQTRASGREKHVLFLEGLDRGTTVAAFGAADVFVFGSRLECSPLVLFETCAAATPFISTDCGNAREIARWTGGGRVARTVVEMAAELTRLAADPARRRELGRRGRAAIEREYNWTKITEDYERLYTKLCAA